MPARPRKRPPRDFVQNVHRIVSEATSEKPREEGPDCRNPAAVALGALGASKGGKARAQALTQAERQAIAKKAAAARWKREKP